MAPQTPTRTLCPRCMETVDASDLEDHAGERLCGACRSVADRAANGPALLDPEATLRAPVEDDPVEGRLHAFFRDAAARTRGRTWAWRAPLVAYLAWILVRSLLDSTYTSWFGPLNLGIHELGHLVFRPFGTFLHAAGGTILQCLVPVVGLVMFRRQREDVGLAVAGGWLATNLLGIAVYVGDARARALPLVTVGGGDAKHDWSYLLGELGLLRLDGAISAVIRVLGLGLLAASVAFGAWLVWIMVRSTTSLEDRP